MTDDTQRQMFIADILGRIARANITAMGMHAENMQRQHLGNSIVYGEDAFLKLIEDEQINSAHVHNTLYQPL